MKKSELRQLKQDLSMINLDLKQWLDIGVAKNGNK